MSAPADLERPPDLEQRRLAKLVETMHDGLLLLDERGSIRLANAAASRLLDIAEPTSFDSLAEVVIHGRSGEVLPEIVSRLDA